MSSGERAKPPATYEERNPFDISRRSGKDVAAEIAQRMAAWKQARGRSYATRSAVPSAEAKQAPIAAPVQPARLPKFAEHAGPAQRPVPRPANPPLPPRADASAAPRRAPASAAPASTPTDSGSPASAGARIPFFASFSAVQRAMPPAPSLKRPAARREPAPDTINIEAPHIEMPAPESHEADSRAAASPQVAIPEQAEIENPVVAPAGDAHGAAAPLEAEASAASVVEARDIAAPDADAPADAEAAAAPVVETPDRDTHRIETVEAPIAETASQAIEAEVPTIDRPVAAIGETEAVTPAAAETPDRDTHRVEAHRDTPAAETRGTEPAAHAIDEQDLERRRIEARNIRARWIASHDIDVLLTETSKPAAAAVPEASAPLPDTRAREPVAAAIPEIESPVAENQPAAAAMPDVDAPVAETLENELAAAATPEIEADDRDSAAPRIDSPLAETYDSVAAAPAPDDKAAGRREPTLDWPGTEHRAIELTAPVPLAAETDAKPRIALRGIETRIEARRLDSLRADPHLAERRPIFPHIELEDWDIPPVVAARTRARAGTGWAIGLGALLLIIGITAPAAIWQHGRQTPTDQDQVAMLNPAPAQPVKPAAGTQPTTGPTTQATLPEAPQPEAAAEPAPPAPPPATEAATPPAAEPDVGKASANDQATLGAVRNGGELNEAPISTPPAPVADLASKPKTQAIPAATMPAASKAADGWAMVPRPFVPDPGPAPFLRAPAGASVAVDGAAPASVGLKPSLMGQLKPQVAAKAPSVRSASNTPQKVTRKPRPLDPRNLDQMFQTLIDTLSEGQPVNPANKPAAPSTRR